MVTVVVVVSRSVRCGRPFFLTPLFFVDWAGMMGFVPTRFLVVGSLPFFFPRHSSRLFHIYPFNRPNP
jgi:hypothetical protein